MMYLFTNVVILSGLAKPPLQLEQEWIIPHQKMMQDTIKAFIQDRLCQ